MPLLFEDAAKVKDAIMASQQQEIQKLYDEWAKDIAERAKFYSHKTNASAAVSERYYKELYAQMKAQSDQVGKEIQGIITSNMYTIADAVVASNVSWLKEFGFSEDGLNAAFSYIPNDVVQRLVTGQIYQGGWNLSQRIWSDNQQTQKDIYQIMARGLAEQKSVYEIAKDLESYVKPSAKLPWNPVLAMRNTKTGEIEYKRIYKKQVDYNAQRLARTLAQHSYQQSFIATTQKNPFITSYRWHSNGSRVCELCMARHLKVFKKDELPMDHPNGMCTMEPIVVDDMVDQLADWFNSPDGTYPEIDAFAGNFGYEAKPVKTVQDYIDKYGASKKSWGSWYDNLTKIQKAEAKALKDQSGLTWKKWYEQNIYSGDGSNLGGKKKTVATKTVKTFNSAQQKYLAPYGFTPDNMPKNFSEWSHAVSHDQASEILKSIGSSWNAPHPYQDLMKYYESSLKDTWLLNSTANTAGVANKVDDAIAAFKSKYPEKSKFLDVVSKAYYGDSKAGIEVEEFLKLNGVKVGDLAKHLDSFGDFDYNKVSWVVNDFYTKNAAKVASVGQKTAAAATKVDDVSDLASWFRAIKAQDESHMLGLETNAMKIIGKAGEAGLRRYTGSDYQEMNSYLRYLQQGFSEADAVRKSYISEKQLKALKDAIDALDRARLPEDLVLRRGSSIGDVAGLFMQGDYRTNRDKLKGMTPSELNDMFSGAVGQFGSFTSTSSLWDRGFGGDVEYIFYAPKGSSASSIMSISQFGTSEGETLLNAGTRVKCLRIEESDGHKQSRVRVFLQIIPDK